MKPNKRIDMLLSNGRGTLSILHRKIAQLSKLTALLKNSLPEPLRQHCEVANIKDDCLIIKTNSATWATQIRYLTPDLLKQLQQFPECKYVRTLRCYIDPDAAPTTPYVAHREPLSDENIQLFNAMSASRDDALGRALKRLAKNANDKKAQK